jgi:deoxycytidylate deaminase
MNMQIAMLKSHSNWNEILLESAFARVEHLKERVDLLAQESLCSELKVAFLLVDRNLSEIAHGINKSERNQAKGLQHQPPNWLHAEKVLATQVIQKGIKSDDSCVIGGFSPCRYCVMDLKQIGVKAIVFSNLYWDTPALELSENLGMQLFYFSGSKIHLLTHSTISGLSRLNIIPVKKNLSEKCNPHNLTYEEEKDRYLGNRRSELSEVLNTLLMMFIKDEKTIKDPPLQTKILKLLSQVETEQECIRLARINIILRKQPW